MHPDTELFLTSLFGRCGASGTSMLTFTAIHPSGNRPTPSRHVPVRDAAGLSRTVEVLLKANREGWGAYVGIAPRRIGLGRWQRGGRRDLVELPALYVDIDQAGPQTLDKLAHFALPPSCIVASSTVGLHAYWLLYPTQQWAEADLLLRGLAQHFGGDSHMTVAQSMRLPQTHNTKSSRANALCQVILCQTERCYDLAEFRPHLPSMQAQTIRMAFNPHVASQDPRLTREQFKVARQAVEEKVISSLAGFRKANGFLAALCPYPHERDRPGQHFNYAPRSGRGFCFGKHGSLTLFDLCQLLGVHL